MKTLWDWAGDFIAILRMPRLRIDLMYSRTRDNDPFYARITQEFFESARRPHSKFPFVSAMTRGVAVCCLPDSFDGYFMRIEAAARRNVKKAQRLGYRFERIEYNRFLDDIRDIRTSADVRQGQLPDDLLTGEVMPCTDPPSRTSCHDYVYFGVLRDDRLVAYAGCMIGGQLCMIEHILGHAARLGDGIVPMLITGIAQELYSRYPQVRFYSYGMFFGAGPSMRRFKKKFQFLPYRVDWNLGRETGSPSPPA